MRLFPIALVFVLSGCTTHTQFRYFSPNSVVAHKATISQEKVIAFCDRSFKAHRLTNPIIRENEVCGDLLISENPHRERWRWGDELQCVPLDGITALGLPYERKKLNLTFSTVSSEGCKATHSYPKVSSTFIH